MHLRTTLLFLTLVAFSMSARATTTNPSPDFHDNPQTEERIEPDPSKVQLTHITQPPHLSEADLRRAAPFFYKYRNDFSISAVGLFGKTVKDNPGPVLISGLHHQFTNSDRRSFDISAEIISDGTGLLSFSRRWNHSTSRLRPYHLIGIALLVDPKNQFATVLYFTHYFLRFAAGLDYSVGGSFSLRAEALGLIGPGAQNAGAGISLVWGF